MKFCTLASGSSGNCVYVCHGRTGILIDAGISMTRIKKSLAALGGELAAVDGVFITHDHIDHIRALKMLVKYYNIPIFATWDTYCGIVRQFPEVTGAVNILTCGEPLTLGELEIVSFPTPHDAVGSVGYRVNAEGVSFALVTDVGYITQQIYDTVWGVDAIVLEANHDIDMLRNGPYPYYLQQRILSRYGHLSNVDCGQFAASLAETGTKRIVLAHLSEQNNTPELAYSQVKRALAGADVELTVAPRSEAGEVYII